MRLIDADKVKEYIITEGFYCDTEADREATAKEIDKLFETVQAIPVEWIRKWHGVTDIKDCDLRDYVTCTLLYMIKDWKNENDS